MKLDDAIGKLVLFKLDKAIEDDFRIFKIPGQNLWAILSGIESNIGTWIRHPKYELEIWLDGNGSRIPKERRKKEDLETDILIPWRYIKGIMCVRDERFREIEDKASIGFHVHDSQVQ
ncbi:MAG: hypothetical protein ACE5F6_18785 [Anaerolineae bacterium]